MLESPFKKLQAVRLQLPVKRNSGVLVNLLLKCNYCSANQWIGFYMTGTSITKELNATCFLTLEKFDPPP